jgi:hypothetical protein
MVRGAPERDRQRQPLERGEEAVEQHRVFDCELAGQPVLLRVEDVEAGLDATEMRARRDQA